MFIYGKFRLLDIIEYILPNYYNQNISLTDIKEDNVHKLIENTEHYENL
jgi:hypothetical protein